MSERQAGARRAAMGARPWSQAPRKYSRKLPPTEPGRVCAWPGCITVLGAHNHEVYCLTHLRARERQAHEDEVQQLRFRADVEQDAALVLAYLMQYGGAWCASLDLRAATGITDSKRLQDAVTRLRREGYPIEGRKVKQGGYRLRASAQVGKEVQGGALA